MELTETVPIGILYLKEGIASPRGKLWDKTSVHYILINEAYTGTLIWGTNAKDRAAPLRVEKAFSAIITRKQFDRVARLMNSPSAELSSSRSSRRS